MQISEMFYSIQGEGKRTGNISFFIRTNYCNLRCKFNDGNYCDTPYTSWNPSDTNNLGEVEIDDILKAASSSGAQDIVITGGEPTMYPEDLLQLVKKLKEAGNFFITLETNGTHIGEYLDHIDLISLSPKLHSSTPFGTPHEKMHSKARINLEALRSIHKYCFVNKKDIQWKFVYSQKQDIEEIKELQSLINFESKDVYLMPEGITAADLERKRYETIQTCVENKFAYTDRLHILIWGNKRGV